MNLKDFRWSVLEQICVVLERQQHQSWKESYRL